MKRELRVDLLILWISMPMGSLVKATKQKEKEWKIQAKQREKETGIEMLFLFLR